ncbi:MAG: ABC transporter ATP-binding protein [Chitinophagaceae bacterium]|nr:ABC transporter ATP-binding protein [Chitinophagaceae bacterium]
MIQIKNLSFGYRKKKLLYNSLSLNLAPGSIIGLLGKNGAGKSTLLKNMTGLLFPKKGHISVNGFIPKKRQPSFLKTIYMVPEEVHVPGLTIKRYQSLFSPFYPNFDKDQFIAYLDQLDVRDQGSLNTFSFGQQKKFIIAFALACNTEILLLDEPTNGLDIPSKAKFRKLISSIFDQGKTIFISTHQIRDLDNLIDRVIIVDNGEILLNASITEISEKLCFKTAGQFSTDENILYAEQHLKGFSIVGVNKDREDSKVNLEHLFNAITENPIKVKEIFA